MKSHGVHDAVGNRFFTEVDKQNDFNESGNNSLAAGYFFTGQSRDVFVLFF